MKGFLLGFKVSGLGIRVRCLCLGFGFTMSQERFVTFIRFMRVIEGFCEIPSVFSRGISGGLLNQGSYVHSECFRNSVTLCI